MFQIVKKFFSPSVKPICEEMDIYTVILELNERIDKLEQQNQKILEYIDNLNHRYNVDIPC